MIRLRTQFQSHARQISSIQHSPHRLVSTSQPFCKNTQKPEKDVLPKDIFKNVRVWQSEDPMLVKHRKRMENKPEATSTYFREIIFGKKSEKLKKMTFSEKMGHMGHSRAASQMISHRPDSPTDLLKNHWFGTPLRRDGKIAVYDEKQIEMDRKQREYINSVSPFRILKDQVVWLTRPYIIKEYNISFKNKTADRTYFQLAWIGHSSDILLKVDIQRSRRYFELFQFPGWQKQSSWRTGTLSGRLFLIIALLFTGLILVEVPLTILRTFFQPLDLLFPGLSQQIYAWNQKQLLDHRVNETPEEAVELD